MNLRSKFEANRASQSRDTSEQSFEIISSFFSSSFCTLCIFDHNLRTHTPIKLKLGTRVQLIKAHLRTNFGWNPIKIYGVIIDFLRKKGSKVCHTYRVNRWKELDEIWHVGGVIIVGVPFCGLKEIGKRPWRYDTKSNQCQNYAIEFVNKNSTQLYRNRSE